jgi:hypothetical protein
MMIELWLGRTRENNEIVWVNAREETLWQPEKQIK